jgi:YD repeat-containing protein
MRVVLGGCAALALATPVVAQQVQAYDYDVHGRLISVSRVASGATQTTTYGLDGADNRSAKVVATSSPASSQSIAAAESDRADAGTISVIAQEEQGADARLGAASSDEVIVSEESSDLPADA